MITAPNRAKETEDIEASIGRVVTTLSDGPSFAGKAAIIDRLLTAKTKARNLAWNLRADRRDNHPPPPRCGDRITSDNYEKAYFSRKALRISA